MGGRRGQGTGGGTLAATPPSHSAGAPSAPPGRLPRPNPRHKGGDRRPGARSGEPPDSGRRALTPSRRRRRLPGPAGCTTPPAASPGKRGRQARFLLRFLRLGPSSSPAAGVSGRRGSRAGPAGRGRGSTTTWPPGAGPRRPGSRGSGKGGANRSPPLPPRAAPNSASQVIRTCGRYSRPARPGRPRLAFSFPRIVEFSPVDLSSSSPEVNGNHRCSDPRV